MDGIKFEFNDIIHSFFQFVLYKHVHLLLLIVNNCLYILKQWVVPVTVVVYGWNVRNPQ